MENIKKGELITTGKAKSLYESNESDFLIMHYRDDTSAFDGKKIESLEGKGTINNKFNADKGSRAKTGRGLNNDGGNTDPEYGRVDDDNNA